MSQRYLITFADREDGAVSAHARAISVEDEAELEAALVVIRTHYDVLDLRAIPLSDAGFVSLADLQAEELERAGKG